MNAVIVMLGMVAVLFALAFFTKRRFGLLGLALTAGATLSAMWAATLTPYIRQAGLDLVAPPLQSVVAAGIIVLPAVVLLFSGPMYTKVWQRVIGSALFALLAMALLFESLGSALVLQGEGQTVYALLGQYRTWIITAGILLALFDLLIVKAPKHVDKEKH